MYIRKKWAHFIRNWHDTIQPVCSLIVFIAVVGVFLYIFSRMPIVIYEIACRC